MLLANLTSDVASHSIDVASVVLGLAGGLAIFLYGMQHLTDSLQAAAGAGLKTMLARLTTNRFRAFFAGFLITSLVQSSTVTTVMVVGFVSAGLLTLQQSIGIILGANLGSTLTAQLIAFNIYHLGLLLIIVGFLGQFFSKLQTLRFWSLAVLGVGLILFGMQIMGEATSVFRQWPPLVEWLQTDHPAWVGVLVGFGFTAIVQSSAASIGLVIIVASQGLIQLEFGIAMVLGANAGTCLTALLSSIGRPRAAVQTALVHLLINIVGLLIWIWIIPQFADFLRWISGASSEAGSAESLAAVVPRQIANAHTFYNLVNTSMFLALTSPLARLAQRLVPEIPVPIDPEVRFLDDMYLQHPDTALEQARLEATHMAGQVSHLIKQSLAVATTGSREEIADLVKLDRKVEDLHGPIVIFLGKLSQNNLNPNQATLVMQMIGIANYLENIGDIIENNLMADARKRIKLGVPVSSSTLTLLKELHAQIVNDFDVVVQGLESKEPDEPLQQVIANKRQVNKLSQQLTRHLAQRLVVKEPNRLAAFQIEARMVENYHRIHTLTRRIAREWISSRNEQ